MGLLLLAATLGGGAVQDASAQAIQAKVVDATNNRPIRDAEVQLLGPNGGVVKAMLSDRDGRVYLTAPRPGVYMVAVQRLGYPAADTLRVNLEQGRTITTQIALQPEAIEVEGVTVTAEPINWNLELVGFYNRQRGSTGYFKEIGITDERRAVTTSDYFRQARGVQVDRGVPLVTRSQALGFWGAPDAGGQATADDADPSKRGQGGGVRASSQCLGLLIVDGLISGSTAEMNLVVSPKDVAAVEVHANPATAPPQWRVDLGSRGSFACGIFVVWTKRGSYDRGR
jgi:hypothetical protein